MFYSLKVVGGLTSEMLLVMVVVVEDLASCSNSLLMMLLPIPVKRKEKPVGQTRNREDLKDRMTEEVRRGEDNASSY
jgi:hypothetical protein